MHNNILRKKNFYIFFFFFFLVLLLSYGEENLIGELTIEEILENFPEWQIKADSYTPSPEIITKLKSIDYEVKIEVFLGTWCPDSKEHVSSFFKVMKLLENPHLFISYIGLPREKESRKNYIQGKNIIKIPTFIISVNNKEIGRIIETPSKSVEEDILSILTQKPQIPDY